MELKNQLNNKDQGFTRFKVQISKILGIKPKYTIYVLNLNFRLGFQVGKIY